MAGFLYHAVPDPPSFFSNCITDGGLITLSRFPIIEHEWLAFPFGVLSDALSQKGVLFTKILINHD